MFEGRLAVTHYLYEGAGLRADFKMKEAGFHWNHDCAALCSSCSCHLVPPGP